MSVRNYALGASLAVFALAAAAPSAHALTYMTGGFDVSVYQYNAGGDSALPGASANPQFNNLLTAGNLLGSGTYTGDINFSDGGLNQVANFLHSAGGSWVFGAGTDPWTSLNQLSTSPVGNSGFTGTTAFVFTGTLGSGTTPTGTITSDDGAELWQGGSVPNQVGGTFRGGNAGPQNLTPALYAGLTAGVFELLYIETNGIPAQFIVLSNGIALSEVPLPAALPLFATGLGALGFVGWRRKRKSAAAIAA